MRIVTVLVAALALLPAAAWAQASGDAPANASKAVKRIYADYQRDGIIDVCDHARGDLQDALDTIEPDFDRDFPDFRAALEAGIARHKRNGCASDEGGATTTATPAPTSTPQATPSPSPAPAGPASGGESGKLPESEGNDDGGGPLPPESGKLPAASATPSVTAVPTAPAATPIPTVPAATPAPPTITHAGHGSVLVPVALIALALLGAAALAASAVFGRRSPGLRHAWREAAFRTRGTWADFSDWLRLGR